MSSPVLYYTTEKIGPTRFRTPDGFLLCVDVPIARIGEMLYAPGEVPVEPGRDKIIRISRDTDALFSPDTVASAAGKPVVNDHPPEPVTPENWKKYSIGTTQNPRRGDGKKTDSDFLYADLLICDQDAIADIEHGKREVSAGYQAEYSQDSPGYGRQHQIVFNHVALVDKGRCGPRCMIGDNEMPVATRSRFAAFKDRIMRAARTGDEAQVSEELDKIPDMIGKVLSGDEMHTPEMQPTAPADAHHVTINVHGAGMPKVEGAAPVKDDVEPDAGNGEAEGGVVGVLEQIVARLEALEEAVAILSGQEAEEQTGTGGAVAAENPEEVPAETPEETPTEEPDNKPAAKPEAAPEDVTSKEDEPAGEDKKEDTDDKRLVKDKKTATKDALTTDSRGLKAEWQETLSRAEMLVPGILPPTPTFDAALPMQVTRDSICAFRRRVLTEAYRGKYRDIVEPIANGGKFAGMTCDAVQVAFNAASEMVRQANNRQMIRPRFNPNDKVGAGAPTPAEINRRNRERFANS